MPVFTDIPNEFLTHPSSKDLVLKNDELAVRQAIRNLINLSFGDKPFHEEILINIRGILFENITPFLVATVKRNLTQIIQTYEPRAEVVEIQVGSFADDGAIVITIIFKVINSSKQQTLEMFFERVR